MCHIQTEDYGFSRGYVCTHIFVGGVVIAFLKTAYPADIRATINIVGLRKLMQESHKQVIRALCSNHFNLKLERVGLLDRSPEESKHEPELNHEPNNEIGLDIIRRIHQLKSKLNMADINKTIKQLHSQIAGCLGVALVDHDSGMALATMGSGINMEIAAAGNMEVVRAKMRVMESLGIDGGIEDILITLSSQYHIIRPVGSNLFLYLAINSKTGNLAMARHQLTAAAKDLKV